jgi:hypothetical protein
MMTFFCVGIYVAIASVVGEYFFAKDPNDMTGTLCGIWPVIPFVLLGRWLAFVLLGRWLGGEMKCRKCRKEFTQDNPESGFGHCKECING